MKTSDCRIHDHAAPPWLQAPVDPDGRPMHHVKYNRILSWGDLLLANGIPAVSCPLPPPPKEFDNHFSLFHAAFAFDSARC